MKPVLQYVPHRGRNGLRGYWACRWRKDFAYKSGVGDTPQEAYADWVQQNGVHP